VGLGNFEGVFNTVRRASLGALSRNLHPESDWLWTGVETGWTGLLASASLVLAAAWAFLPRTPVCTAGKAAWIIALLFFIHSFFDVSSHRLGTMWACLYLVGLGSSRNRAAEEWTVPRPMLRLLGLGLLVLAGLRLQALSAAPWMPIRGSLSMVEADLAVASSHDRQRVLLDRALGWAPLDWRLYGQRGLWALETGRPGAEAAADFDRALYLDQSSIALPLAIGEIYRPIDFDRAMDCWTDALARAGNRREEIYRNLFLYTGLDTKSRLELTTLAGDDPDLRVMAVIYQDASQFDWQRANLLANDPELNDIRTDLLRQFLDRWADAGDVGDFLSEVPRHARWLDADWTSYGKALAEAGQYRAATETFLAHLPAPVVPPATMSAPEAMARYQNSPRDPWAALQAYVAETGAGQRDQAIETLRIALLPPRPSFARRKSR
jgi:tetratricopeptide (TPR) repeat protein